VIYWYQNSFVFRSYSLFVRNQPFFFNNFTIDFPPICAAQHNLSAYKCNILQLFMYNLNAT